MKDFEKSISTEFGIQIHARESQSEKASAAIVREPSPPLELSSVSSSREQESRPRSSSEADVIGSIAARISLSSPFDSNPVTLSKLPFRSPIAAPDQSMTSETEKPLRCFTNVKQSKSKSRICDCDSTAKKSIKPLLKQEAPRETTFRAMQTYLRRKH
jgi:hypothetical protein